MSIMTQFLKIREPNHGQTLLTLRNALDLNVSATKSHLWNYLQFLLNDPEEKYIAYIQWLDKLSGVFKIVDPQGLARLWGQKKNIPKMNYDKMSRSLRNYYKNNKLKKVPGQRQVYQFIFSEENPAQIHPQVALYWQMIQTQLK